MDTTPAPDDEGSDSPHPAHVGPYKILERLGEGGMGTVYLAEQTAPVQRRVALKLIKLGMDSRAIVARFDQERQALAMMQHEGIARVYDCGTSERGQPFFVMELVKGMPLTDYCERNKLDLEARLQLMRQVCAAIQHAHQKGVVHRDLKPGNTLVSDDGGRLQVKVIDFGLAKAMGQKLVEASLFTEAGQVMGTLEYMAPEQADLHAVDVDTRADIYSLGVMLYELLVGCLPFSGEELRAKGFVEMQRMLREVDPPKPSSSLSRSGQSPAAIADARRTSIGALKKMLRNDLDWVVLKALEKDRNRRYETANALALDLQRFLDNEPLAAGPPSASYRLKKLVRRHRGQVAAAAAVLLALVGGVIGTYVQYRRAEDQKVAEQKSAELARKNELLAKQKAAEALREKERADQKADEAERSGRELEELVRVMQPLALRVLHDRAVAAEAELHPPWPEKIPAMRAWLGEVEVMIAMRGKLQQTVAELEFNALPPTERELEADRRSHPEWSNYEALSRRVAAMQRAESIRQGSLQLDEPVANGASLGDAAHSRGAATASRWQALVRRADELLATSGHEADALAFARAALDAATSTADQRTARVTLARALLANGKDVQSLECLDEAIRTAPADQQAALADVDRDLRLAIEQSQARLAEAEGDLAELSARINRRRTFRFANDAMQFLHGATVELLAKLDRIANERMPAVSRRITWAQRITELSRHHPNARVSWDAVRAALARADGVVASRAYRRHAIELRDEDIVGLVPIGMNPVTRLWEFYELRSAWDGTSDPATLPIPAHTADGKIAVTPKTGVIFALLPGGDFWMGAQKLDASLANFALDANQQDWPHRVELQPFFLARHEMTQAQWARLSNAAPRDRWPSLHLGGERPVEQVDWQTCTALLAQHALLLPTEAQWEYACRADGSTPWHCAEDQLSTFAMLDYRSAGARNVPMQPLPAGTLQPNAFGLHDMHGNVGEWCRDPLGSYADPVLPGDGLRMAAGEVRVVRGGDFTGSPARAAAHVRHAADGRSSSQAIGLRPVRRVRPLRP